MTTNSSLTRMGWTLACGVLWLCTAVWTAGLAVAVDRFVLEIPGDPRFSSTASLDRGALTIVDGSGQAFVYERSPREDSTDGAFAAFYSEKAQQYIRWPVRNAGGLQIGRPAATGVVWQASKMRIQAGVGIDPLGNPAGNPSANIPIDNIGPSFEVIRGGTGTGLVGGRVVGPGGKSFDLGSRHRSERHVAMLSNSVATGAASGVGSVSQPTGGLSGLFAVGTIDDQRRLQLYVPKNQQWEYIRPQFQSDQLVAGAPLVLVADPRLGIPRAITIGQDGGLLEIVAARQVNKLNLPRGVQFQPASPFDVQQLDQQLIVYAVDDQGRLLQYNTSTGQAGLVDGQPGRFAPGSQVKFWAGRPARLFAIDRAGHIVSYTLQADRWAGPELLASGFVSGAPLTTWTTLLETNAVLVPNLAAIDRRGQLHILQMSTLGWRSTPLANWAFPPGSSVAATETVKGVVLSTVLPDGRWVEIYSQSQGQWGERIIANGFAPGAPVMVDPLGQVGLGVDLTGRLMLVNWAGTGWRGSLLGPEMGFGQHVTRRSIVQPRELSPVTVELVNRGKEELVIGLIDLRHPGKPQEIALKPQSSTRVRIERDGGGLLEESFAQTSAIQTVENVRRLPIPGRPLYDVAVYANRVTYKYIDRRQNKGPLENFEKTSLVSVGTFRLPPGEALTEGSIIDVLGQAQTAGGP